VQASVQQLPVPLTPQMPDLHCWFPVQAPVAAGATQAPPMQTKPSAQSPSPPHEVLHPWASAQARFPGQAPLLASQKPLPSQALAESVSLAQLEAPQLVPCAG
jgi:hypothetical protein